CEMLRLRCQTDPATASKIRNRLAAPRAAAQAGRVSMRSLDDGRLTRWTAVAAGAAMNVAAAWSGRGGGSAESGVSVGDEVGWGLGTFDGASAPKGYGAESSNGLSEGFTEAHTGGTDNVAYVDVEHTRTPDIEVSQAMAHVAHGSSPARVA